MKFIENTIRFITFCFFSTITSIISTTIIAILCVIIEEIGFVENINFKSIFVWVFILPTHFLLFCLLSNIWIDRSKKAPETNKEEHQAMKTPEIDKEVKQE